MIQRQKDMKVPSELITHCPICGKPMTMNLGWDDMLVQDESWYNADKRYSEFIRRHENLHFLYLALGGVPNDFSG